MNTHNFAHGLMASAATADSAFARLVRGEQIDALDEARLLVEAMRRRAESLPIGRAEIPPKKPPKKYSDEEIARFVLKALQDATGAPHRKQKIGESRRVGGKSSAVRLSECSLSENGLCDCRRCVSS